VVSVSEEVPAPASAVYAVLADYREGHPAILPKRHFPSFAIEEGGIGAGTVIRFNLDSILRADFKSRQEGLKIQREMGVINPNEWREIEGKGPQFKIGYLTTGPAGRPRRTPPRP